MIRRLPSKRVSFLILTGVAIVVGGLLSWKPLLIRHRLSRARSALENRDANAALESLEANERLAPDHAETHFWLARAYRRLGRYDKVREHLERAWKLGYSVESLEREQWLALAQSGQLAKAERHLSRLLKDPRDDGREICEAYVAGYLLNFRFDAALQILEAWQKDFPQDGYPFLIRGKILEAVRRNKDAIEQFRKALQLDESLQEARLRLAKLLVAQHSHDEAVEHFQRCVRDEPENPDVLVAWSNCLMALGRQKEARGVLERVLERKPGNWDARKSMGELELSAGHPRRALSWLEPVAERYPQDRTVRYALARTLQRLGRKDEAVKHFKFVDESQRAATEVHALFESFERNPTSTDLRFRIGMYLMDYESPADGVAWLNSVVQIDPAHRRAHEALAAHYERRGAADLAKRHRRIAEQLQRKAGGH